MHLGAIGIGALGIANKGALQDLYADAQKGVPEVAQKVAPEIPVRLHLFM